MGNTPLETIDELGASLCRIEVDMLENKFISAYEGMKLAREKLYKLREVFRNG